MTNYAERYRPSKIADINKRADEANPKAEQSWKTEGITRLTVNKTGEYLIRMLPSHPGGLTIEPKTVYWLPSMIAKRGEDGKFLKDENDGYVRERGRRPYFDAKTHGGAQFDLVDTYISLARKKADELYPGSDEKTLNDKKKYLEAINGSWGKNPVQGIAPTQSFLFYGVPLEDGGLGDDIIEYEIRTAVKKGIEKIAATESAGDVIGTDGIFTDPEDGLPLKITVNQDARDPKDYYSVNRHTIMAKENIGGKMQTIVKTFPITDELFAKYDEMTPLSDYRTKFNHFTLKYQALGLEMVDEDNGYGIMEMDEFQEVFNYLDKTFPKPDDDDSDTDGESSNNTPVDNNADEFTLMDMRELKEYIKENQLHIVVLPRYSEDDVRDMIRVVESSDDELGGGVDESEQGGEVQDSSDESEVGVSVPTNPNDIKTRLEQLRKSRG